MLCVCLLGLFLLQWRGIGEATEEAQIKGDASLLTNTWRLACRLAVILAHKHEPPDGDATTSR
jgi:hypothetical protein